jgi:hypothetical protein
MRTFGGWLRGGDDELGWDDLVRRIVEAVAVLAHRAERGRVAFPQEVAVRIVVAEGSLAVLEGFLGKPELDREVEARLANRFDCDPSALPVREYVLSAGDRTSVVAAEAAGRVWELAVEGGDLSGCALALPPGADELRFGRGEWHGPDRQVRNDLVICEKTEFVSRRAGRFSRTGHQLEVTALDQGDALLVRKADGEVVRPARTASGRIALRPGEAVELVDGRGGALRLTFRERIEAPTHDGAPGGRGDRRPPPPADAT